jgi:hypothetical protein
LRRSDRKRREDETADASAFRRRYLVRRARVEFDARHPTPTALSALARAIVSTAAIGDAELAATDPPLVEEQLTAAVDTSM